MPARPDPRVAVVLITADGRERLDRSLTHLTSLPEAPEVIVVDNASTDGTPEYVEHRFPGVTVVRMGENLAAAGRNAGVAVTTRPYVAFAEDDSWYEPEALRAAADLLDAHPRVGLVQAHVRVGEDAREEPLHADMVDPPLPDDPALPGHPLVSFLEGVCIVRRKAFAEAGGFDPRLSIGGPEEHLGAELMRAGWELRYVPWVGARHVPDHGEPSALVRRLGLRNTLWFSWLRRPWRPALRWTAHVLRQSGPRRVTLRGFLDALAGLPWILRERRLLPAGVEDRLARLDAQKRGSRARRYR